MEQLFNTYFIKMFHVEQKNLILLQLPSIKGNTTMENRVIFRIRLLLIVPRGTFIHRGHTDDVPRGTLHRQSLQDVPRGTSSKLR